jgi:hypothetical protein
MVPVFRIGIATSAGYADRSGGSIDRPVTIETDHPQPEPAASDDLHGNPGA